MVDPALDAAGDAAVEVRSLVKRFGDFEALRGLSLHVPTGQVLGVVGPNGSGKSTLFRHLVGLLEPTSGEVRVLGRAAAERKTREAIGYMPQTEALYDDLSVDANVRFFARIYGLRGAALDEATARAIATVELTDRSRSVVRELSGGMRRRTSLACAVVHRPRVLLLDEPTVGVDPELRLKFWKVFREWVADGATLLISTHHLEETRRCDRLVFLRAGEVIADGTPSGLAAEVGADTLEDAFMAYARRAS